MDPSIIRLQRVSGWQFMPPTQRLSNRSLGFFSVNGKSDDGFRKKAKESMVVRVGQLGMVSFRWHNHRGWKLRLASMEMRVELRREGRGESSGNCFDKATQQKQKRMIKNRESAATSRKRKHAYAMELEAQVKQLEEENEKLLEEVKQRKKERLKQIMML